jgi:hypothetical protein
LVLIHGLLSSAMRSPETAKEKYAHTDKKQQPAEQEPL